jgi:large repetitive protein
MCSITAWLLCAVSAFEGGPLETNYGQADPATFVADFSVTFCSADPTNPTVAAEPPGNTNPEHQGRRVTFDFGDVRNPDAVDARLVVTYEVVVLNILANQDGVGDLNNSAAWTWDGGSLEASADPLEIVEPDMDIRKDASPLVAPLGATITFTFDIYHTPESSADAFDVVVTDVLPPSLGFVPGTFRTVSGLVPDEVLYNETTRNLTLVWYHFPLGDTSFVEFQAVFLSVPAVNTVNLEWTSLPIDPWPDMLPPTQQSDYNEFSTERWYDPPDQAGLNTYGRSSSVSISVPSVLPATGFAPGRVSALPAQPAEKAYNAMSGVWIEIPDLGVRLPMLDVPLSNDGWDLTWLSNQAGYLDGTTRPGDVGTMGVTAHITLADGTPGPFQNLRQLSWGNKVIMYANGYRYTYEVRENRLVLPRDMSVLRQDGYAWMTLITCEGYSSLLDAYTYRVAVRAVLLSVEPDNSPYPFASLPGPSAPSRAPAPQYPGGDR